MRLFHISDVHLGSTFHDALLGALDAKNRSIEIMESFLKFLDFVNKKNVKYLMISGDLFNQMYVSYKDINTVFNRFSTLNNTRILIVCGNHDPLHQFSFYHTIKLPKNVYVFDSKIEKKIFEDDKIVFHGYSFPKRHQTKAILEGYGRDDIVEGMKNILIIHGDNVKESSYLPLDVKRLKNEGFDYIALGHIHQYSEVCKGACYAGSFEPLGFDEPGMHGYIDLLIEENDISYRLVPFSKRKYITKTLKVTSEMNMEEILKMVKANIDEIARRINIYKIVLEGYKQNYLDDNILKERISSMFYYVQVDNRLKADFDIQGIAKNNEHNLLGAFIESIKGMDIDSELKEKAMIVGIEKLIGQGGVDVED